MPETRIILRNDTTANWAAESATSVKKGEVAFKLDTNVVDANTTIYTAAARLGINAAGSPIDDCIQFGFGGVVVSRGQGVDSDETEITVTRPVTYEENPNDAGTRTDGAIVRWDAANTKWVVDTKVVTLDAYPSASGTVVYDASAGNFVVGTAITATELDGGTYGGT